MKKSISDYRNLKYFYYRLTILVDKNTKIKVNHARVINSGAFPVVRYKTTTILRITICGVHEFFSFSFIVTP